MTIKKSQKLKSLMINEAALLFLGIYFALVLIYGNKTSTTYIPNLFFILFSLSVLFTILLKKTDIVIDKYIVFVLLFEFNLLIGFFFSQVKSYSYMIIVTVGLLIGLFFLITNLLRNINQVERSIWYLFLAGLAFSFYSLFFYGGNVIYNSILVGTRLGWEIGAPNSFGYYTALTVILAVYYALFKNRKSFLMLIFATLPFFLMIGSYSKKAFLVCILGILLILIFKYKKKALRLVMATSIFSVFLYALLQIPQLERLNQRINSLLGVIDILNTSDVYVSKSDLHRKELFELGLQYLSEKPVLGYGTGSFRFIDGLSSHNNFVELAANNGLIGILIYYIPISYLVYKLLKISIRKNDSIAFLLFVLLFLDTFLNGMAALTYTSKISWLILGISVSFLRIVQRNEKESHT